MLAAALQAEVAAYIEQFADALDEDGHRLVVRNGYHQQRDVATGAGAVTVTAPRVNDKRVDQETGERQRFSSKILPAWSRKSPKVAEVLPLLYLHGLSSLDFAPALEQFLGSGSGLSAATVTRLTTQWQDEAKAFEKRDLSQDRLRLPLGRRYPPEGPARAGEAVPAGDDRCPGRRPEGARRVDRRVPGVDRVLGGSAAGRQAPRDAGPGARHGRRCAWASGRRCGTCSRPPGSSGAGSTSRRMCLLRCRSRPIPGRSRRCRKSTTRRTSTTPGSRSRRSRSTTAPSSRRPWRRSPTTSMCCWSSTTTRPTIGCI